MKVGDVEGLRPVGDMPNEEKGKSTILSLLPERVVFGRKSRLGAFESFTIIWDIEMLQVLKMVHWHPCSYLLAFLETIIIMPIMFYIEMSLTVDFLKVTTTNLFVKDKDYHP